MTLLSIRATFREPLRQVLDALLEGSEDRRAVTLDEIGESLGVMAVNAEEIDALLTALEAAGRRIDGPDGAHGESRLRVVIAAARELRAELGRTPRPEEIAARASMPIEAVRHALALAKVMQR